VLPERVYTSRTPLTPLAWPDLYSGLHAILIAGVIAGLPQWLKGDTIADSLAMLGRKTKRGNDRSTRFGVKGERVHVLPRVWPLPVSGGGQGADGEPVLYEQPHGAPELLVAYGFDLIAVGAVLVAPLDITGIV
jgi:hypothetical protein